MTAEDLPLWPLRKAASAVATLARAAGFKLAAGVSPPPLPGSLSAQARDGTAGSLSDYLDAVATSYALELESVQVQVAEVSTFLRSAAPAVVSLAAPQEGLLLLLKADGQRLQVLATDGSTRWIALDDVADRLLEPLFAPHWATTEALVAQAGIRSTARGHQLARVLLQRRLASQSVRGCFLLRLGPSRPLSQHIRDAGLPKLALSYAAVHTTQYVLGLILLFLLGEGALNGRLDRGWLSACVLLLLCLPPCLLAETWILGRIAIAVGIVLRRRLLWGALKLPLDAARQSGYGDYVCQVIESEAVEIGLRTGGVAAGSALLDLLGALPIMAYGSPTGALALGLWILLTMGIAYGYYRVRGGWTESRFRLGSDLLEKMLGHRTRLVQQPKALRHRGEDEALADYHTHSWTMDGWNALLFGVVPFGWLALGVLTLLPVWFQGGSAMSRLAVGLGGVLLGFRALGKLGAGLAQLGSVAIALRRCRHLLDSAAQPEPLPLTAVSPSFAPGATVLEAKRLTVRYGRAQAQPALRDVTLRITSGQRVLLQGPSGSGKSTLASSLTGLLPIDQGQILLGGLDLAALGGKRWRQVVATAPQFHENHLFTQPLAFNLLMGRAWPPSAEDLAEAQALCEELGLGPLLSRMPSGLYTQVGETGWQLSHGERSRVFIARTLLQRAQVVFLDESFAALDPETLALTLRCVFRRVPTLFVIAHP